MYMALKRTTVFADEDDLAIIKAAAQRRNIAEAELIREAIHVEAMANRTWSESFFTRTYIPKQRRDAGATLQDVWDEKVAAYERTKNPDS